MRLKFRFNDDFHVVKFEYTFTTNAVGKKVECTTMTVDNLQEPDSFYRDKIIRHPKDPLNKEKAHRILFAKFLNAQPFGKLFRERVWEKFFSAQKSYNDLHQW